MVAASKEHQQQNQSQTSGGDGHSHLKVSAKPFKQSTRPSLFSKGGIGGGTPFFPPQYCPAYGPAVPLVSPVFLPPPPPLPPPSSSNVRELEANALNWNKWYNVSWNLQNSVWSQPMPYNVMTPFGGVQQQQQWQLSQMMIPNTHLSPYYLSPFYWYANNQLGGGGDVQNHLDQPEQQYHQQKFNVSSHISNRIGNYGKQRNNGILLRWMVYLF